MTTVNVQVDIPEGFELADTEMRPAKVGEHCWLPNWDKPGIGTLATAHTPLIILRPIAPAYVYPKVRREDAEARYSDCGIHGAAPCTTDVSPILAWKCRERAAMREALEGKGEPIVGADFLGTEVLKLPACGATFQRERVCLRPANHIGSHA